MSKLLEKLTKKISYLMEEIEYDMDSSKTLSNFLARKFKENPVQFAETFFGEPELIKKWRETYSGRRVLPNPRKYGKDDDGMYGWQQNWQMDKDAEGNKVAKRQGQKDVPYITKELDPSRKQLAMQNVVGSQIKVKRGGKTVDATVLAQEINGKITGKQDGPPNDKGDGAVLVWAGSAKQDVTKQLTKKVGDTEVPLNEPYKSTEFSTPVGEEEFWVSKDEIVFDPVYKGFDQDQIPPEVVLRRLTMPDNKYENFKRYIVTHVQDPDEGFFTFDDPEKTQGLASTDPERAKAAQKEKVQKEKEIVKEKEKIVRFLETMKTMTPSERVRYLFNMITFAKGLSKKQKAQTPGDRGQFKMIPKNTVAKQPGTPPRMSMKTGKTQSQHINLKPKKFKPGRGKV